MKKFLLIGSIVAALTLLAGVAIPVLALGSLGDHARNL
jgi:hypothetical protein